MARRRIDVQESEEYQIGNFLAPVFSSGDWYRNGHLVRRCDSRRHLAIKRKAQSPC